jgi:hypothetical protein
LHSALTGGRSRKSQLMILVPRTGESDGGDDTLAVVMTLAREYDDKSNFDLSELKFIYASEEASDFFFHL